MLSNMDLKIGDLIIEKPIVQGGMGVGISLASLAYLCRGYKSKSPLSCHISG